jgi:hypothetical protein
MYKNNTQEPNAVKYLNSKFQRFDIINHLIEKNGFLNYLEIGVFHGENIRMVKAAHKDGVDPGHEGVIAPEVTYPMTSDAFFNIIKDHPEIKYDVIFIDGLHHANQVDTDIENALKHLVPNGYIVLHDCNPISFDAQKIPRETVVWNGDVWKSIVKLRLTKPDLSVRVVDTDFGVGIVNLAQMGTYDKSTDIDWNYFDKNREEILNLITVEQFKELY